MSKTTSGTAKHFKNKNPREQLNICKYCSESIGLFPRNEIEKKRNMHLDDCKIFKKQNNISHKDFNDIEIPIGENDDEFDILFLVLVLM